jgi:hypothetical protein
MSKSMIVSVWSNYSQCSIGAEWNFIKDYWDITFTFLFWSISFSKDVAELPESTVELVEPKKAK